MTVRLITPSIMVGSWIGMHPYFQDVDNDLSFKLGEAIAKDLTSGSLFSLVEGVTFQFVKNKLFENHLTPNAAWLSSVESYMNHDGPVLFAASGKEQVKIWTKYVIEWLQCEHWSRTFIDDPSVAVTLMGLHMRQDFYLRLKEMRANTVRLINPDMENTYHYYWQRIKHMQAYNQSIRPSDMEFFLSKCSFLGALRQIVALEWVRNVKEGFVVNTNPELSMFDNFL